ncbi:ABC transporter ATP-binding protein [Methanococcus maripaludis]|uniref:Molybdate/tungstate import ATP-binding protein WtpC n=2 Tax=Methanococcus maripaludis TaxID=39152 RepID=A0A7J9PIQ7_METMI|nr:ABC transporter ATP-binding protein [Methanococcus maripaludis]MBA2862557.1 iron(III) transport system ATP-binding protein [Methanococcus maripaludis]
MVLKLENVSKNFEKNTVLKDINFECAEELVSLVGSSGCGKTTCLRVIAGFEKPDQGRLFLNGEDITNIPPNKRNIGMVFQNYALFPHLTVFENIAYGLKLKNLGKCEISEKVKNSIDIINLGGYEKYSIEELSGGMQQRVAIARAMVIEPKAMLLDEPLSNLDAKLRIKMRKELKELQRNLGIPTIYVTHDQEEALALSDKVAVMNKGEIEQFGEPYSVYSSPKTEFVAKFIGVVNELPLSVIEELNIENHADKKYFVRPESLDLGNGKFQGKILDREFLGSITRYVIKHSDFLFTVQTNTPTDFKIGDEISFDIDKNSIILI